MEKKIAGVLGTIAALGTISSAHAVPVQAANDVLRAHSYAELLEPVANAGTLLQAMDEQNGFDREANVQLAQYHHHHHRHHNHYRY